MKASILSLAGHAPSRIMTNEELARIVDTSDEWIFSHTGIKERRIAQEHEAASDLGYEAAKKAIQRALEEGSLSSPQEIDLVLCATSTPDHLSFPATASIIQDKLGISEAGACDLGAACTGFIYALETAKAYVLSGMAKKVLVLGTEVNSRILNWKDRSTCVLFGDGAGAALVGSEGLGPGLGRGFLRSRGSGASHLLRPQGGSRISQANGDQEAGNYIHMNGRQVYIFAVQAIIDSINTICQLNGITFKDLDWVIPHQANRRIIEAACERAQWPLEKFFLNMDKYANTSAASIPLAAEDMLSQGLLKRGQKVATVGFGAGLAYGGNYFIY